MCRCTVYSRKFIADFLHHKHCQWGCIEFFVLSVSSVSYHGVRQRNDQASIRSLVLWHCQVRSWVYQQQDEWTSPLISGANVTAFLLVIPTFFEFVCAGSLQALVLDSFRFFFYAYSMLICKTLFVVESQSFRDFLLNQRPWPFVFPFHWPYLCSS